MIPTVAPARPEVLLEVRELQKTFVSRGPGRARRDVCAARNVSFRIGRGEAVALVGESGSGKSTIARMLSRLETPDSGGILLSGVDMLQREPGQASLEYRGRVQMVFQDPYGSLHPLHRIEYSLLRPLQRHAPRLRQKGRRLDSPADYRERALELLRTVGLQPAEDFLQRFPHELSGGQRQRVAIARALAAEPEVLVADEPTSMLDVSIRMGVLNLLAQLKKEQGLAILMITHDLASARYLADRILVLYQGRIVEDGPSETVVDDPVHPYTKALLASIAGTPRASLETGTPAAREALPVLKGSGCPFAARCGERLDMCLASDPDPRSVRGRMTRCHLYPADASGTERSGD